MTISGHGQNRLILANANLYIPAMETVVILVLAGALLLLLETVLPGMVAGILGLVSLVAAVVVGYQRFDTRTGNIVLIIVVLGLTIGLLVYIRFFPKSRAARVFVSQGTVGELGVEKPELLEQNGTATSHLRPSGTALINGRRVDVVTEGEMIERGTPVKVVAVEGLRVVVRRL